MWWLPRHTQVTRSLQPCLFPIFVCRYRSLVKVEKKTLHVALEWASVKYWCERIDCHLGIYATKSPAVFPGSRLNKELPGPNLRSSCRPYQSLSIHAFLIELAPLAGRYGYLWVNAGLNSQNSFHRIATRVLVP